MTRHPIAFFLITALVVVSGTPLRSQMAQVLQPSDLAYLGFYEVQLNGENSTYSQALTHRYVDGELRLLLLSHGGYLDEFSITGRAFNEKVNERTARWQVPGGVMKHLNGLWFESAKNRLWVTSSADYTVERSDARVTLLSLHDEGRISIIGRWSFRGVPEKRVYGGCQPSPVKDFPYVCGWGGYTSLMNAAGGASLGPTMYAIQEPTTYRDGSNIPVKTILDAESSRGVRSTIPQNYFDGGDPRPNPPTPPTAPVSRSGDWQSPNRDKLGWFVWGDSYYNTGVWIDGPKPGFLMVASLCKGSCWYQSSTLAFDGRQYEWHIWDPAKLGSNRLTRPSSMTEFVLPHRGDASFDGNTAVENIAGATFDAASRRLYLLSCGGEESIFRYSCGLFTFSVAGQSPAAPAAAAP